MRNRKSKFGKSLTVRFEEDLLAFIGQKADGRSLPASSLIRMVMREWATREGFNPQKQADGVSE